jgi:hypothetical protein
VASLDILWCSICGDPYELLGEGHRPQSGVLTFSVAVNHFFISDWFYSEP